MEANFPPPNFNALKTRNILSLADRVEVIREHDRHLTRPSLQSLAEKFECSSKQIKNILLNRDSILRRYRNGDAGPQKEVTRVDDVLQKSQDKIAFLGKVLFEYIQRVLYFNHKIDDEKVIEKALQIKECIAVENFEPTHAWLEDFKQRYVITRFDLQSLRNNIVITEAKRPHLSAIDMIQYVSRMEQESKTYAKPNVNGQFSWPNNRSGLEPKIIYEIEDEDDEELKKLNFDDSSLSPLADIESVDEALKHVKALEEYAMLHDNFRAISLLTQLEQIFKKQDKKN